MTATREQQDTIARPRQAVRRPPVGAIKAARRSERRSQAPLELAHNQLVVVSTRQAASWTSWQTYLDTYLADHEDAQGLLPHERARKQEEAA